MTLRKLAPGSTHTTANPSLLRELPISDHSSCLNRHSTQNIVRPAPEPCNQTIIPENRSFSNRPPQQRPTTDRRFIEALSPLKTEPSTPGILQAHGSMTTESSPLSLTVERMRGLQSRATSLSYLWAASPDPPITKESLSELELARIINDVRLRHDLNFEREVSFRPNTCGDRGKRKKLEADTYWEALITEFAIYITQRQSESSNPSSSEPVSTSLWLQRPPSLRHVPLRLPGMFKAIQEILKTLVPGSEWTMIDDRLDIDLILRQLEKGVCDIPTLIEWLGGLLQRCCSPQRDHVVIDMVSSIRNGFENNNPYLLVKGLRDLFGVLELMKLVSHPLVLVRRIKAKLFAGCCESSDKIPTLAHGRRYHSFRAKEYFT